MSTPIIKKLPAFEKDPDNGVSNTYDTKEFMFKQPALWMICGSRGLGKSHLCSKFLAQAKKDNVFDNCYLISPSYLSNLSYFGKFVPPENAYAPTKDSIDLVIKEVEKERDEWEEYQSKLLEYKEFKKLMADKTIENMDIDEETISIYDDAGFFEGPPEWKRKTIRPATSILILDDVIGTSAIAQSSGLTRLAVANRHQGELKDAYMGRSALGLAVIILVQTYRAGSGVGTGRVLRENLSLFTTFKWKMEKQLDAMREEIGAVIDLDKFDAAYKVATEKKHGSLTIDFTAKCNTLTFRKGLGEAIIFPDQICECSNKNVVK